MLHSLIKICICDFLMLVPYNIQPIRNYAPMQYYIVFRWSRAWSISVCHLFQDIWLFLLCYIHSKRVSSSIDLGNLGKRNKLQGAKPGEYWGCSDIVICFTVKLCFTETVVWEKCFHVSLSMVMVSATTRTWWFFRTIWKFLTVYFRRRPCADSSLFFCATECLHLKRFGCYLVDNQLNGTEFYRLLCRFRQV